MNPCRITTVLDELRAEEAELQDKADTLRADIKTTGAQLAQVRKAMSSLKGKPSPSKPPQKATATKEEVVAAIREILASNGGMSEAELKQLVEKRVTDRGKSRSGFAICFKHAVRDRQFLRTGTDLRLAGADNVQHS